MTDGKYDRLVVDTLEGRTGELRSIPTTALDWSGSGALLDLYRGTSGNERSELIESIGRVIEQHSALPTTLAQLIHIAACLDLAQVEPQVRGLQPATIAQTEPVKSAVANYLAFRALKTAPVTRQTESRATNGPLHRPKPKSSAAPKVAARKSVSARSKSARSKR